MWPGHEANHSPPSDAEVNDWSCVLPLPLVFSRCVLGGFYLSYLKTSQNRGTKKEYNEAQNMVRPLMKHIATVTSCCHKNCCG